MCRKYRDVLALCDADDTVLHSSKGVIFDAFNYKLKLQKARCGLVDVVTKAGVPQGTQYTTLYCQLSRSHLP